MVLQRLAHFVDLQNGNDGEKSKILGMSHSKFSRLFRSFTGTIDIDEFLHIVQLLHLSNSDVTYIITGERDTPTDTDTKDVVAAELHDLSMMVRDLLRIVSQSHTTRITGGADG